SFKKFFQERVPVLGSLLGFRSPLFDDFSVRADEDARLLRALRHSTRLRRNSLKDPLLIASQRGRVLPEELVPIRSEVLVGVLLHPGPDELEILHRIAREFPTVFDREKTGIRD